MVWIFSDSVFTARRACIARTMLWWQDVCLSVRLTHADILSKRLNIIIVKVFFHPGKHTILVFSTKRHGIKYSDGNPNNEDVECKGVFENRDFRPTCRFVSEMIQNRATVITGGE